MRKRLRDLRWKIFSKWGGLFYYTKQFRVLLTRIDACLDKLDMRQGAHWAKTHDWHVACEFPDEEVSLFHKFWICQKCEAVTLQLDYYAYPCVKSPEGIAWLERVRQK